jgi:hypothetical protein
MSHLTFDFGACFIAVRVMGNCLRIGYVTNSLCSEMHRECQA